MVSRCASPYPDSASFLADLAEGMVPQDRYYATLSAWIADGSALYTRGRAIRILAREQMHQGIISETGEINWSAIDRQTPHWVYGHDQTFTIHRWDGGADIRFTTARDARFLHDSKRPLLDRETVQGRDYPDKKRR